MARYGYTHGGAASKLIWVLVIAGLVTLMAKNPVEAATWTRGGAQLLGDLIGGIGTFLGNVVNR